MPTRGVLSRWVSRQFCAEFAFPDRLFRILVQGGFSDGSLLESGYSSNTWVLYSGGPSDCSGSNQAS